jgi:hypothetical protein
VAGSGLAAVARIVAIVLVGVGTAGLISLAGTPLIGFVLGVVAMFIGGVFVFATNLASWLPLSDPTGRSGPSEASSSSGFLGLDYGIAVVVGLVGAGLVLGWALGDPAIAVVIGLWGLLMLLLVRR